MIKRLLLSLLFISILLVLFYYGRKIPYSDQSDVYGSIRDIASFVFGVMGIWLAIFSPDSLILPIVYSLVIIAGTLLIEIFTPVIKEIVRDHEYVFILRGISYATVGFLGLLQLYTITVALNPGRLMLSSFSSKIKKDEVHGKLFKLTQKRE